MDKMDAFTKDAPSFRYFYFQYLKESISNLVSLCYQNYKATEDNSKMIIRNKILEIYNTCRLEGNTASLIDAKLIVEKRSSTELSYKEQLEIENQYIAYEKYPKLSIVTLDILLDIHAETMRGILPIDECGVIRTEQVYITGSHYSPPHYSTCKEKVEVALNQFNRSDKDLVDIFTLKFKLVNIHPFVDGNGRVSRLIMNSLLSNYGFTRLIITEKAQKYYYETLELASVDGKVDSYLKFSLILLLYQTLYGYI